MNKYSFAEKRKQSTAQPRRGSGASFIENQIDPVMPMRPFNTTNPFLPVTTPTESTNVIKPVRKDQVRSLSMTGSAAHFLSRDPARTMSMVEPENAVTLTWQNVKVKIVEVEKGRKNSLTKSGSFEQGNGDYRQILKGVSGYVLPGTLLAVMGASGSGKSTLLNVLSGHYQHQYCIEGDVRVNGVAVGSNIRNISAYVQQDDLFFANLTVREILTYRAMLKMSRHCDTESRLQTVEELIEEMGLTKCADTRVGREGPKLGISGGEAKRLSVCCEMLTNPPLLFCDEPTSGLDTFMAQNIIHTLQNMTHKNRTILCTIHQPSSQIFAMFDRLMLVAEGRVAYFGSTKEATAFFRSLHYPCPTSFNPADFFVMTLAIVPGQEETSKEKVKNICDAFENTQEASEVAACVVTVSITVSAQSAKLACASRARYESSWFQQLSILLWRAWVSLNRDVFLFRVRIGQTIVYAVVLGLIFLQLEVTQRGVININSAIFNLLINCSFTTIMSIINTFPMEMSVFLREYVSGLYRTDTYFLAKNFAEVPTFLLFPFIYATITYWLIGLRKTAEAFLTGAAIMVLVSNIAVSFAFMLSAMAGTTNVALALAGPMLVPFMMFGGFFLNDKAIPSYFMWFKHISWFRYANELLVVNQWAEYGSIPCEIGSGGGGNKSDPTKEPEPHDSDRCQFKTGQDVVEFSSFSKDNNVFNVAMMFVLLVGYRFIAYIAVLIRARRANRHTRIG